MPRGNAARRGAPELAAKIRAIGRRVAGSMVTELPFGHQKLIGIAQTLMNDGAL